MQDRMIHEMQEDLASINETLTAYRARKPPSLADEQAKVKRRAANKRARKARRQ